MPRQKKIYTSDIQDKIDNPYLHYSSNFLDEKEQALLLPILKKSKRSFRFDGGYPEAQRKILIIDRVDEEPVTRTPPISALLFKKTCELTHRNVLGTVLSLGVNRDTVGDIAIWEDKVQIVILDHLSDYFLNNFKFINNNPVEPLLLTYDEIIPYTFEYSLETITASSNRLDAIVASIFKTSRKRAIEYIKQGFVLHNHLLPKKVIISVENGDTLSLKGKGKVQITGFGGKTKKGRIRINYKKFK